MTELHADLFTSDQRNALWRATVEARRSVWETAERAVRRADHPELADSYTRGLAYDQRHLAALESLLDAANTWTREVAS